MPANFQLFAMEHSVLDEALGDFAPTSATPPVDDDVSGKFAVPSAPSQPESSHPKEASSALTPPQVFDPLRKGKLASTPSTSRPAFDPLKQGRTSRQPGSKAKGSLSSGQNRKAEAKQQTSEASSQPQTSAKHNEIDADLARGVAQLMADLAKAGPSAEDNTGKASPHEREIASTLAALAAAVPISSRGAEEAGSQSSAGHR